MKINYSFFIVVFVLLIFFTACGRGDGSERLGNGYVYVDDGSYSRYIENEDKKVIKDIVVSYGKDSEYIYALRQIENSYYCDSVVTDAPKKRKIFITNDFEYWVIKVNEHKVLGPFNQGQFDEFYKGLNRGENPPVSSIHEVLKNNYAVAPSLSMACENPILIN